GRLLEAFAWNEIVTVPPALSGNTEEINCTSQEFFVAAVTLIDCENEPSTCSLASEVCLALALLATLKLHPVMPDSKEPLATKLPPLATAANSALASVFPARRLFNCSSTLHAENIKRTLDKVQTPNRPSNLRGKRIETSEHRKTGLQTPRARRKK